MKLFVTRHGQSEMNALGRICGRLDPELTQQGVQQAKDLADSLKQCNIEVIVASPLKRAKHTAEIVSQAIGVPVITDERLIERDYGIFEGVRSDEEFRSYRHQPLLRYPSGESFLDHAHRAYSFLDEAVDLYGDKTVLLVCHAGTGKAVHTYFHSMTMEAFSALSYGNCEVKMYDV